MDSVPNEGFDSQADAGQVLIYHTLIALLILRCALKGKQSG
ncbi:hypothetical protein HMPREF9237_01449 [Actinotignum schaalii FB123-CNA-2]|uniref:Uncharacterized protein n=1 Tax=Actinotignum schaalii FB123-CNA-2 TaxID=883067 RepID=S2WE66_9ACTO|nr:hypothetical protein HMPREF9237_01449 [Actinotignum schaalii FB123-CNA-2]